ncbi:MAG: DUF2029 domain-containing protein, partial [Planctomycetia bacterium]|nr:DUF2029 domain-containing protein [Planctomycetia bacterium]
AVWLLLDLTGRALFGSVPWPQSVVDYRILYDASRQVVETHQYPPHYPYPPPAVAVHAASAVFPFAVSAALWLVLTGLAAGACYFALARAFGLHLRPGSLLLLPIAHLAVAYYFQWDMRSINCNLIVLAAVVFGCAALVAKRDRVAGFWFALSIGLKVFPVLILPYLAWTRRWRAFGWAAGLSVAFWLVVPAIAFGLDGSRTVYGEWMKQLTCATDPALKNIHPILISLDKAALHATGGDARAARAITFGMCALWVVIGVAGAAACRRTREQDAISIFTHVSLLIIGPVAVNPYLEPYHLVPLVVPALIVLIVATDRHQPVKLRIVSLVAFVIGVVLLKGLGPWPLRGLLVNAQALILCATAVWVAWARVHTRERCVDDKSPRERTSRISPIPLPRAARR